jgi:secondary thiamine-phosphate synthase enzyme
MLEELRVNTPEHDSVVDLTDSISRKVKESGLENGVCVVYVPHTTAGITINEGADPSVMEDVLESLDKLVPWRSSYRHTEGNSAAHIKSVLVGGSVKIIVEKGKLALGTWQHVFLCEFDGPRTRKVLIKLLRDS